MQHALVAEGLTKIYRGWSDVKALTDLNLKVKRGMVFGLLGRNGAGKTTFVNIAATLLKATGGRVEVLGRNVLEEPDAVRRNISLMPQEGRPLELVSPWEHVYGYLRLQGAGHDEARRRAKEVLDELELSPYRDQPALKLSGGLRRRILVAMILASDREILFLDEPTLGLDPVSRRQVWSTIQRIRKQGRTILYTTHYMDEAEMLADEIAIIELGRLLVHQTPSEIKHKVPGNVRVSVDGVSPEEAESYGEVIRLNGQLAVFTDEEGARELTERTLSLKGRVSVTPITLEDAFLYIVKRPPE